MRRWRLVHERQVWSSRRPADPLFSMAVAQAQSSADQDPSSRGGEAQSPGRVEEARLVREAGWPCEGESDSHGDPEEGELARSDGQARRSPHEER